MEMMLKTNELCKTFKDQKAVNKVSLNIPKGCVYGLLGPNGAGKSTTLKMITGIMKPTDGEIIMTESHGAEQFLKRLEHSSKILQSMKILQQERILK